MCAMTVSARRFRSGSINTFRKLVTAQNKQGRTQSSREGLLVRRLRDGPDSQRVDPVVNVRVGEANVAYQACDNSCCCYRLLPRQYESSSVIIPSLRRQRVLS